MNQNVCEFDIGAKSWYQAQLSHKNVNERTENCHEYFDSVSKMIHNSSSSRSSFKTPASTLFRNERFMLDEMT